MIRSTFAYLYALIVTPYYAARALRAGKTGPGGWCKCESLTRTWARKLLKAAGATVEVKGLEHFDPDAPHIIIANHQSWFDVFAMAGYLPTRFRFVAKAELSKIPIFGPAWVACGHVSIDRKDRARAFESIAEAGRRVKDENLNIVLFPEGTRSADGRLQPFKKGAFVLAIQSGVPVVPLAVMGSREVMPKGKWRLRPGHIELRLGTPIPVEGLELDDRNQLMQTAWDAVRSLQGDEIATESAA